MQKSIIMQKSTIMQKELQYCFSPELGYEIGVDEAGRGPMLGRVYTAAVILPKTKEFFNHALMKDSKKFHSDKKIREVAEYIKANAIAWYVGFSTEQVIDKVNIRNATHKAMHEAIRGVLNKQNEKLEKIDETSYKLLIDGNDFTPFMQINSDCSFTQLEHVCIEGGDNKYSSIAAASILAKVSRDSYIEELCLADTSLIERYDILNNKGYGTKKHMEGIKQFGITPYHRKSFGICKNY
jgi:ribonuclease HII